MSLMARVFGAPQQQVPQSNQFNGNPANMPHGMNSVATMPQPQSIDTNLNVPAKTPEQIAAEQSPLHDYANLFTIDKDAEGKALPQPEDFDTPFNFNVDPKKINEQISKLNFTSGISPDIIAKIKAGGDEAISATLAAMDHVGKQALLAATITGSKTTEAGLEMSRSRMSKTLPDLVRKQSISNALREDNPLFTNPAIAPMMEAMEAQFTRKYPTATAAEIKEHTQKYMLGFATEAAKAQGFDVQQKPKESSSKSLQTDWENEPTF